MIRVPDGGELMRPFLPAKDFDTSKRFYEALGFEKTLDGEVAIFMAGSGGFILQRYYQKEWAENFMMQIVVDEKDDRRRLCGAVSAGLRLDTSCGFSHVSCS